MCGIAAIVTTDAFDLQADIDAMTDTLIHRGPDDRGTAVFPGQGVALGMRRLSILDLESGQQPMWDEEGRHCIVFNGEIYNFAELRRELAGRGHRFVTDHSDTEALVHGFEEWGVDLFPRLNGMFALAIWDRVERRLTVARDRTGKKPLYIAKVRGGYAIASELKALLSYRGLPAPEVDPVALEQYLAFDYVLGPRTILRGVEKLSAAHYATIDRRGCMMTQYWKPQVERLPDGEDELLAQLDVILSDAVRKRMVADVPVGLFLSGGLDSTTVGHYMRQHSDDVHSFSIGFEEKSFDESHYADLAARALGTHHHVEIFSQDRVRDLVPRIAEILDEPMGDQSIFPTYLLSTFTQQHVKVALGGDGSDELLMGYNAYRPLKVAWTADAAMPRVVRRAAAATARRLPNRLGGVALRGVRFARRLDGKPSHRLLCHLGSFKGEARWVLSDSVRDQLPASIFGETDRVLLNGLSNGFGPADQTVIAYLRGYLQEDILVKVDRASMATSLEVRAPFLDPELIDFLLAVPPGLRLRGMTGKYLLRRLMRGRIPAEIISRPKIGFGVPLNLWLRESLAPLVREYLEPGRIAAAGFFDPLAVTRLVDEHLSCRGDRGHELWLLLQFELWRERWLT